MTTETRAEIEKAARKYAAMQGNNLSARFDSYIAGHTAAYESFAADREKLIECLTEQFSFNEMHFIESMLNEMWYHLTQKLDQQLLGVIDRQQTEQCRDKCKLLMDKIQSMNYNSKAQHLLNSLKK